MPQRNPILRPLILPNNWTDSLKTSPDETRAVFEVDEGQAELDSNGKAMKFIKHHTKKFSELFHGSKSDADISEENR